MYFTNRTVPSGLQAFPLFPPNNTDHHGHMVHILPVKNINLIYLSYHHKHLPKLLCCCSTCPWGKYWTLDLSQCCTMRVWMRLNSCHFLMRTLHASHLYNKHSQWSGWRAKRCINAGHLLYICESTVICKRQEVSPSLSCVTVAYSPGLHTFGLLFEQAY